MFSEFEVDEFYKVENYLSEHLSKATDLRVGKLEKEMMVLT